MAMRLKALLYKRLLLVVGLLFAPVFWVCFRFLSFKKLVRVVSRWPKLTIFGGLQQAETRWVTRQIIPEKYWPLPNPCVVRTLVLLWMQPRKRYGNLSVHKGVARQEKGWQFHMWLEANGDVISDARPQHNFKKLASISL